MNGYLPVKVNVPLETYKGLNSIAQRRGITVGALIEVMLTRVEPVKSRTGRPSDYSPELGAQIAEMRARNMSWVEISVKLGRAQKTVRDWYTKYLKDPAGLGIGARK